NLTCPVQMNYAPNALAMYMTFYNDNSNGHCNIQADLLRSNINSVEQGGDLGTITTSGSPTFGRHVFAAALRETIDFDTSFYWFDVDISRDATLSCNPQLVGVYLQ